MSERPILFSTPMVEAILARRKTVTRRVVVPQPENDGSGGVVREGDSWIWRGGRKLERAGYGDSYVHTGRHAMIRAMLAVAPWREGDRLWVRETWRPTSTSLGNWTGVLYRADGEQLDRPYFPAKFSRPGWRSAMFMPRAAARIFLAIESVYVQRLVEISDEDARDEGVDQSGDNDGAFRASFRVLWDSLNAKRGHGWGENPWVWVIRFVLAQVDVR